MTLTHTLTQQPELLDDLIRDVGILIAAAVRQSPLVAVEGETEPMRALILAWVVCVEAAAQTAEQEETW